MVINTMKKNMEMVLIRELLGIIKESRKDF
jgi:hypothetical protein